MAKIRFQTADEAREFALLEPTLLEVVKLALASWPADTMDINEIARGPGSPDWNPNSWHCRPPHEAGGSRAVDIRIRGVLDEAQSDTLVERIHARYLYDPTREEKPVALVHSPRHLHLQTHPRTARKR